MDRQEQPPSMIDIVKAFPKQRVIILGAWLARYNAEKGIKNEPS